jgi:succinate-acetate transporter protein
LSRFFVVMPLEGMFCAGTALYTSFALIVNDTWGRYLLPLGLVKK